MTTVTENTRRSIATRGTAAEALTVVLATTAVLPHGDRDQPTSWDLPARDVVEALEEGGWDVRRADGEPGGDETTRAERLEVLRHWGGQPGDVKSMDYLARWVATGTTDDGRVRLPADELDALRLAFDLWEQGPPADDEDHSARLQMAGDLAHEVRVLLNALSR